MNAKQAPDWVKNLAAAHEGVLLLENREIVAYCNPAIALMLGREWQKVVGSPIRQLFRDESPPLGVENGNQSWAARGVHGHGYEFPVQINRIQLSEDLHLLFVEDRSEIESNRKLIELLAYATDTIGSSLDYETTQSAALDVPLPLIGDWTLLMSVNESGQISYCKSRHHLEDRCEPLHSFFRVSGVEFCERFDLGQVLRRSEPLLFEIHAGEWPDRFAAGRVLCLPLVARNEPTGVLCIGVDAPRKFERNDLMIAQELTTRIAAALENARLYRHSRQIEEELIQAKRAAEEANLTKTTFLATMSHEIRTPLAAILGFSELLLSPDSTDYDTADWAQRIRHNGSHLLRLIDDILSVSKAEAGKVELESQSVALSGILSDLHSLIAPNAQSKGLGFQIRLTSPLPKSIQTDPTRLHQILSNLIGNAVKFTERGQVEVTVQYSSTGRCLVFVVSDTGPGLTASQAAKLFTPFTQADASHSRRFGGTGLGLMLSRQLARLLGGDVELLETTPGSGTRFQFILPIKTHDSVEFISDFETKAQDETRDGGRPTPDTCLSGSEILLVDDSEDNRLLVSRLLSLSGAKVTLACDGQEAILKALEGAFDLVLMDVQMPGMDGIQATTELRRRGYTRPILSLTAHALKEEESRCLQAGCDSHLTKPVNRQQLISEIRKWLPRRSDDC